MTRLANTQRALMELYEFVQWYLEDQDGPYPVESYMAHPETRKAAEAAAKRFSDPTLLNDLNKRRLDRALAG